MKYPIGVQSFEDLRTTGCIYIDKTDLVYRLTHSYKYVFLGRPRRFGKSLLISTIQAYFEGRKELFLCTLGYPNLEVETAFMRFLLPYYSDGLTAVTGTKSLS